MLGPENGDLQQFSVLNGILTWTNDGISDEADPRHAEIAMDALGLKVAKGVVTPGAKEEGATQDNHEDKLDEYHTSRYGAIDARLDYLTSDRPDIAFPVSELAGSMRSPSNGYQEKSKRRGNYLTTKPRAVIEFKWQPARPKVSSILIQQNMFFR